MYFADLHIHSRFSRATSQQGDPEHLDFWARRKGIALIGTGDFTHPVWRQELRDKLVPAEEGFYRLRDGTALQDDCVCGNEPTRFVISGEISSIYKKNGRVRKVHNVILLPSLEAADDLSHKLEAIGNIHSDGRPILGLDSRDLLEIALEACPEAVFIPAHIWTPHFSLFGAFSGFDTIEECFEDLTPYIHALETGLSSDPPMNGRISALDHYTLVSNSDAHSPQKLGREANLLETELSYPALRTALEQGKAGGMLGTIEFFPEEGKYHYDGHRSCGLCLTPAETEAYGGKCPICGKKLTIGVQHRVEQLADRPEGFLRPDAPLFESLAPLPEVIAASTGLSAAGKKVAARYESMLQELGPELHILRDAPLAEIGRVAGPCVAQGILRLRSGKVERIPGYDGEFGKIRLLDPTEIESLSGQISLFQVHGPQETLKKQEIMPLPLSSQKEKAPLSAPKPKETADLLLELNEEQRQAVTAGDDAVAVIAGPGSGKTKTLVSRIAWLMERRGVNPAKITAVTFTNQAAGELRTRLERQVGGKRALRGMTIGTFHSICLAFLQKATGQDILLLGREEAEKTAAGVLQDQSLKLSPKELLQEVSKAKNSGASSTALLPQALFEDYCASVKRLGVMDFDDLLLETLALWERDPKKAARLSKGFSFLLIDEFQDINEIQYRLLRTWSGKEGRLFAIGDPDQAIYGFRGSDARCFSRLREEYPALRTIRLTKNYRSTPQVLGCALPVISQNPGGERRLTPQRENGAPTRLLIAENDFDEAAFIAREIGKMVGGMGMLEAHKTPLLRDERQLRSFSDIAVLYRTHRQARILENRLIQDSIPFVVAGRDDFLLDKTVRGTLCFFRFLLESRDLSALQTSLELLWDCPGSLSRFTMQTVCEFDVQTLTPELLETLSSKLGESEPFLPWMTLAKEFLPRIKKEKPRRLLEDWFTRMELTEAEPMKKLLNMAVFHHDLPSFLQNLLLGEEQDLRRGSGASSYASGTVTLMTLHGSKGLEFPVVFLCGVKKGSIPLESSKYAADLEEERRLFYVGMTRAKEELLLLTSGEPSVFLRDIPASCLQQETVREILPPPKPKQLSLF